MAIYRKEADAPKATRQPLVFQKIGMGPDQAGAPAWRICPAGRSGGFRGQQARGRCSGMASCWWSKHWRRFGSGERHSHHPPFFFGGTIYLSRHSHLGVSVTKVTPSSLSFPNTEDAGCIRNSAQIHTYRDIAHSHLCYSRSYTLILPPL
jgi:hypothetical protein